MFQSARLVVFKSKLFDLQFVRPLTQTSTRVHLKLINSINRFQFKKFYDERLLARAKSNMEKKNKWPRNRNEARRTKSHKNKIARLQY